MKTILLYICVILQLTILLIALRLEQKVDKLSCELSSRAVSPIIVEKGNFWGEGLTVYVERIHKRKGK